MSEMGTRKQPLYSKGAQTPISTKCGCARGGSTALSITMEQKGRASQDRADRACFIGCPGSCPYLSHSPYRDPDHPPALGA